MTEGKKNHHKGEYPENWKEIALKTKEKAGWRCECCGHKHDPDNGYTLTTAHMDNDKSNCNEDNLAALCQRCHLKIQAKKLYLVVNQKRFFDPSESEVFCLKFYKIP